MPDDRRNLLTAIERELCACCKPAVRRVAYRFVGERARVSRRDVVLPDQLALAVRLLGAGMTRPDARAALMQRLSISRATAYRLMHAALDARRVEVLPPTHASAAGLRQLAFALDEGDED